MNYCCGFSDTEKTIINTMRLYDITKKTAISEQSNIAWSSAANSINSLIERHIIFSDKNRKSTLALNSNFAYFLGVSLGTSHIKVVLIDFTLKVVKKTFYYDFLDKESIFRDKFWSENNFELMNPSFKIDDDAALWCANTPNRELLNIKQLLTNLCSFGIDLKKGGLNLKSICISFPGKINYKNNTIIESRNLDFQLNNVNIRNLLNSTILDELEKQEIGIHLEHNVKAASVAEIENRKKLFLNNKRNIAVLYFGTGLGISYILDNKLYRGNTNSAGQIGHMLVTYLEKDASDECLREKRGYLEELIRDIFEFDGIDIKMSTGADLANFLKNNNERVTNFIKYITDMIYNIYMLLEIDTIVFSGKLSDIYKNFEDQFQEKMISNQCTNITLLPSNLDEYSAAIGSAICGYYNYLGLPYEWI